MLSCAACCQCNASPPSSGEGSTSGLCWDELYARTARRHGWLLTAGKEESA